MTCDKNRTRRFVFILSLAAGCGGADPAGGTGGLTGGEQPDLAMLAKLAPSFDKDVLPILVENCTGSCHPGRYSPMSLRSDAAFMSLVEAPSRGCDDERPRVTPGKADPKDSYLMAKLTGVDLCSGPQMPPQGGPLPAASIETIRAWIVAGAKHD